MLWSRTLVGLLAVLSAARAAADGDPFDVTEIPADGRAVAAELADLDGDGRTDLFMVVFRAFPPAEQRVVRVHLQGDDGAIPPQPSFEAPLPAGAAAYDVGELASTPGAEVVLLRHHDVVILSLAAPNAERRELALPGAGSLAAAPDERGLERLLMIHTDLGSGPQLLVPGLDEMILIAPSGEVRAQLAAGGRANYLIPARPGLFFIESDIELFFDAPRVSVADVDGDGRADVVSATRHHLRVFLRRPDGGFDREPSTVRMLGLVTKNDHIRGSGGVSTQARDLNGDGRADLLVSHLAGGLTDARMRSAAYLNRDGAWNLAAPDWVAESDAALGSDTLIDVDRDGRPELLRVTIEFSILELVEALVTRSIDAQVSLHRPAATGVFEPRPWMTRQLDVAVDPETVRARGFLPAWNEDLNGDGYLDLLTSGGGDEAEVFLGGPERAYRHRDGRQKLDTRGQIRFGDIDGDHLPDAVLFDPYHPEVAVRLLLNRGALPGSPPRLRGRSNPTPTPG